MFEAWDRDPGHREAVSPESVRRFVLPIRWDFFAKFGGAGGGGGAEASFEPCPRPRNKRTTQVFCPRNSAQLTQKTLHLFM